MSQTFAELGLNPDLIAGLETLGYEQPSKLQVEAVPQLLAGRDAVVEAPPGSGKTLTYVLPILQTLDPEVEGVQVVAIVESSDDAMRVSTLFQQMSQQPHLHVVPVFGGQPLQREAERLGRATTIVVGTPKRIKDHVERQSFSLDNVQFVVIDGADQLLSKKRGDLIEALLDQMPASRQTVILAAQLSNDLQELADQHLFEPVLLKREATAVAMPLIKHRYQVVTPAEKMASIARLLDGEGIDRALIYVNLGSAAELVAQMLQAQGYLAASLNKNSEASYSDTVVLNWREQSIDFLVITDTAAEGLVIETSFAISFDIPMGAESYASRTKLVADTGTHFSLVTARERRLLSEIENFLGQRIKAVLPPTRASDVSQRADAFKQRMRDIIGRSNLEVYMLLLNDLAEEGYDWAEIAAAAVSMVQHNQSDTIFTRRTDRRQPSQSRYSSGGGSRGRERGPRDRQSDEEREVEAGYVRLVMDAGYDIGVRPKDIVGAIANEANIPGRAVGNIDIRDRFTFVEVQEDYVERVLTRVPNTRLRGRVVSFRKA